MNPACRDQVENGIDRRDQGGPRVERPGRRAEGHAAQLVQRAHAHGVVRAGRQARHIQLGQRPVGRGAGKDRSREIHGGRDLDQIARTGEGVRDGGTRGIGDRGAGREAGRGGGIDGRGGERHGRDEGARTVDAPAFAPEIDAVRRVAQKTGLIVRRLRRQNQGFRGLRRQKDVVRVSGERPDYASS